MKIQKLAFILMAFIIAACDEEPILITPSGAGSGNDGIYILCEGLFNQNNSTLEYFRDGKLQSDIFEAVNHRKLGDTANDMLLYGSKLYIAVSVSSNIEIIDVGSCKSLSVIDMKNEGKSMEPRCLTAWKDHVYVCNYDGTVSRIDTTTLKIDGNVRVGRNPDGITCASGKLYVSNSGGLDFSNPDSTVSVIDIATFKEIKKISVRANPGRICSDGKGCVFVVTRGIFDYNKMDYDTRLHRIDTDFDEVTATYDMSVIDMAINDEYLYLYGYEDNSIKIMDITTGNIFNENFICDGTKINKAYSIDVNPSNGQVYICDANDYVTPGTLYCFDPYGYLKYSVSGVGINPNGIVFGFLKSEDNKPDTHETSATISKVLEYCPAPGQFVNLIPKYEIGDDAVSMAQKCLSSLINGNAVTLGGFGGYITVGFDTPVKNLAGEYDFEIDGNSFSGNAEPGIIKVSFDANKNGLADDIWYEIAGSEHISERITKDYSITYLKPTLQTDAVSWSDNQGNKGTIQRVDLFHSQPYWPIWNTDSSITLSGTLLQDRLSYINGKWVSESFEWGYADNSPNGSDGSKFKIEWAVRTDGTPADLEQIDFIRIFTAVNNSAPMIGELSTEVSKIINLHPNNK
jgi:YVTN family beta-propeller protein